MGCADKTCYCRKCKIGHETSFNTCTEFTYLTYMYVCEDHVQYTNAL